MIYLVEVTGVDAGGSLATRYFCTLDDDARGGYVSGPADTPSNQVYEPRIINPGTYERHLWRPGDQGQGFVTVGLIELANADGALDEWKDWDFDGRDVTILRGEARDARADFQVTLVGTAQNVSLSWSTAQIQLRDRMAAVAAMPVVTAKFGGTNVLPNGHDGTADDLKDKYRPLVVGEVEHVEPPRVNSTLLIYHLSQRVTAIPRVFEGGLESVQGVLRTNVAAMEASAPIAGTYDWTTGANDNGDCYIRLGTAPTLPITVYALTGEVDQRDIAGAVRGVLLGLGISAGDLTRLAAFSAKSPGSVGYYVGVDGATAGEVLDALCASAGATWTCRSDGSFEIIRLEEPSGPSVATFIESSILDGTTPIAITPAENTPGGLPTYEVNLSYKRNWTVLTGAQVASAVTDDQRDYLAQAVRNSKVSIPAIWDPTTKTGRNPLSQPLSVVSQFHEATDAAREAARLALIHGVKRLYLSFSVPSSLAAGVELGDVVTLKISRFGLGDGRPFLVTGMISDHASNITQLFCWS